MKVLFIHGARTVKDNNGQVYTDGCFNMNVWNRYLAFTDDFTVMLRQELKDISESKAKNKYNFLDMNKIKFIAIPDLIKPKSNAINPIIRRKHNTIIKNEIKKADLVIVRLPSTSGHVAMKFIKKYNKKHIVEAVGDPFTAYWFYGNIQGKILAPFKTFSMKRDVRYAKNVIYVSSKFMQERYPTKGNSIGCPDVVLDIPKINVLESRIKKINAIKSNNAIVLGLIGSLNVDYRGHETLLKVAKLLKKRGINPEIRFLGDGNQKKMIDKASTYGLKNHVVCNGTLPGGAPVFNWLDDIDILVMPTKQETLGRAVIEAMSRGCPVIGSSETAIGEQIGSDCLVNADDFIEIADKVEKMINNTDYMTYCAYENFYRSFKYTSKQTDLIRNDFFKKVLAKDGEKL